MQPAGLHLLFAQQADAHAFGWWSVLPPVLAIILAIVTRKVVLSLFVGVFVAAILLAARGHIHDVAGVWDGITATTKSCFGLLWYSLADSDHLKVFAFTTMMGAMIGVMHASGGMHGLVDVISGFANTRRKGQLVTWGLGLIVFFDDYANTLLLGGSMRPLTDRLRISREKLAYLVDSTAAPVAGLALVSTWVAGEIGYIQDGLNALPSPIESVSGFSLFVDSIPYRFYVLWALLFVPILAVMRRDFGPMLSAERRALKGRVKPPSQHELIATDANSSKTNADISSDDSFGAGIPKRWFNAVIPVLVVVGITLIALYYTGVKSLGDAADGTPAWRDIFGNADSYTSLVIASACGLLCVLLLVLSQQLLSFRSLSNSLWQGVRLTLPALVILWLAWALGDAVGKNNLGTGRFLGEMIKNVVSSAWLPTIVFLLASLVAFSTGTSWGTMGILIPIAIPTGFELLLADAVATPHESPIFLAVIGSVLAGAIFGDHCSPISDTTVLSSTSSDCDHIAHVRTQLPYAMLIAAIAIVCGTIPIGFGVPVWIVLPLGPMVAAVSLYVFGKTAE